MSQTNKRILIYGIRLLEEDEVAAVEHAQVLLESGGTKQVTMHTIEGTTEQMKIQLLASIDAFFEIYS